MEKIHEHLRKAEEAAQRADLAIDRLGNHMDQMQWVLAASAGLCALVIVMALLVLWLQHKDRAS